MQTVTRINKNAHKILDDIDSLYAYTSDVAKPSLVRPTYDKSFECLVDLFGRYWYEEYPVNYAEFPYKPIKPIDNKNLILAFSGGKDSVASALKFREDGYNVYLYHVKHVNRSFSDEWEVAQKEADLLGMPIFIDDVKCKGNHIWMEHPMKNMIIANGALSYGIRENISTEIAFGNYTSSELADNPFDRCAGDCMDMWETYETILHRILPNFKIHCNLEHLGETLDIITKHKELFDNSLSCLCRHSLRPYRHDWVRDKFGVNLSPLRCGSCYKCAIEYIYLADHDLTEFNEAYYKYCLDQLLKVLIAEGTVPYNFRMLWEHFMMYDIEQSKVYDQVDNTAILLGGVRWL